MGRVKNSYNGSLDRDDEIDQRSPAEELRAISAEMRALRKKENQVAKEDLNLTVQRRRLELETEKENINRSKKARQEANLEVARQKKRIAESETEAATERLNREKKAELAAAQEVADAKANHEKNLTALRTAFNKRSADNIKQSLQAEADERAKNWQDTQNKIEAQKARQNGGTVDQYNDDGTVKKDRFGNPEQISAQQSWINDMIKEMRQQAEQAKMDAADRKALAESKEYQDALRDKQQAEAAEKLAARQEKSQKRLTDGLDNLADALDRFAQEQEALQKSIDDELYKRKIDPSKDKKSARNVAKMVTGKKQQSEQKEFAEGFVKALPGIGVKLGERSDPREIAQNFSDLFRGAWRDELGNVHDRRTDKDAKEAAQQKMTEGDTPIAANMAEARKKTKQAAKLTRKAGRQIKRDYRKNKQWDKLDEWENKSRAEQIAMAMEKASDSSNAKWKNAGLGDPIGKDTESSLKDAVTSQEDQNKSQREFWASTTAVLADIAGELEGVMDEIALNRGKVDTRLNGSQDNEKMLGSYWTQISLEMSATMLSPLVKEETLINNILTAVNKGIARDVTQFGMLETIKEKIATTFDTFDGTMLRLIKIQDENTSAARLGMEASLNEFLNQMYETTEYLESLASSVRSSLNEAEALMEGQEAVEFEYQVQKWLGSLSSVGMTDSSITSIANSLGQLASGDIEGITNGGIGNLLVMAANNANLSISDILAEGLDASETNVLLQEMVNYMSNLVDEANGNKVVQQQLAKVFGLSASELKAATNLTGDSYNGVTNIMSTIATKAATNAYTESLGMLGNMADSMYSRTSLGEMLTNIWANVKYGTASGMASDPVSYITMKVADILDTFAGGIPIPAIQAFGSGVDTKLTVSNIMKSAAMVTGFTGSLISMIASMASSGGAGGFTGSGLLKLVGIDTKVSRGSSTSESGKTVYNASSDDMTESATQEGEDSAKEKTVEAQEESSDVSNKTINENIVNIYNLLKDVSEGKSKLYVNVANTPLPVKDSTWDTSGSQFSVASNSYMSSVNTPSSSTAASGFN